MVRGILNDQLLLKIQSIYKKFMFWLKLNLEIKREPIPPPPPTHSTPLLNKGVYSC